MKNIDKIKFFPISVVRKIQALHIPKFKNRVIAGRDKDGNQFPPYSKGYKEALERDMRIKRGPREGQRHKGLVGISLQTSGSKISKRSLILRGVTMTKQFGAGKAGSDYYELTWRGEGASIVEWQAEKGRDIINDIPDSEFNWVVNQFAELGWETQIKKIPNKTVVKVG
jgi:hypothetical protein